MKRNEYRLLVESWRKVLKEDDSKDDDLYAPMEEPDHLDIDLDYVESQIDYFKKSDDEKEEMLQRFCDMFGVSREEIEAFLENVLFDAGHNVEGKEFDPDQAHDDMPLGDDLDRHDG